MSVFTLRSKTVSGGVGSDICDAAQAWTFTKSRRQCTMFCWGWSKSLSIYYTYHEYNLIFCPIELWENVDDVNSWPNPTLEFEWF